MIQEVLALVPDGMKNSVKAVLRSMPHYEHDDFCVQVAVELVKSGQNAKVEDIKTCASVVEAKLRVSEKLRKDLWWLRGLLTLGTHAPRVIVIICSSVCL